MEPQDASAIQRDLFQDVSMLSADDSLQGFCDGELFPLRGVEYTTIPLPTPEIRQQACSSIKIYPLVLEIEA